MPKNEGDFAISRPIAMGLAIEPQPCACVANSSLRFRHFLEGFADLALKAVLLALAMALIWAFTEAMRTYGTSSLLLPFSTLGQYQPRLVNMNSNNPLIIAFDHFIAFYNSAFPGANRYGSGVGLIAGTFWAMHRFPHLCLPRRAYIGAIAGGLIGFRLTMMISSSAFLVFGSMLLGAIGFCLYLVLADRAPRLQELPLVKLD